MTCWQNMQDHLSCKTIHCVWCHKACIVFRCSTREDTDEQEALLVLCANELAQIYTIIAADKVSQQCLLCVLAFDTAATATASAGAAVVHPSLYAEALLQTELLQQTPSVYRPYTFCCCSCSLLPTHPLHLWSPCHHFKKIAERHPANR